MVNSKTFCNFAPVNISGVCILSNFYDKTVRVIEVIEYSGYFQVHFIYKNKSYSINSRNKALYETLKSKQYPVNFKIRKYVRAKEN